VQPGRRVALRPYYVQLIAPLSLLAGLAVAGLSRRALRAAAVAVAVAPVAVLFVQLAAGWRRPTSWPTCTTSARWTPGHTGSAMCYARSGSVPLALAGSNVGVDDVQPPAEFKFKPSTTPGRTSPTSSAKPAPEASPIPS
jgi:hypothetical protein